MDYDELVSHIRFDVSELVEQNAHRIQGDIRYRSEMVIPNEDLNGFEFETLDNAQGFIVDNIAHKMLSDLEIDLQRYDLVRYIPIEDLFDMIGRYRSGALCDSFGRPLYPDHRCLEVSYEDVSKEENKDE